jgi:uncharacterized cupin superfamily protein
MRLTCAAQVGWVSFGAAYAGDMANIYRPRFEEGDRPEGFRARRARIGYELGLELIGCSLWELPAGEAAYPYHFHYADEELIVVMRGTTHPPHPREVA